MPTEIMRRSLSASLHDYANDFPTGTGYNGAMDTLDLDHVRRQFPVFGTDAGRWAMFENAGGSYACAQTIDALHDHYVERKVQPHHPGGPAMAAGRAMDRARTRWAEALGVAED